MAVCREEKGQEQRTGIVVDGGTRERLGKKKG
jgi:hypothetical protein